MSKHVVHGFKGIYIIRFAGAVHRKVALFLAALTHLNRSGIMEEAVGKVNNATKDRNHGRTVSGVAFGPFRVLPRELDFCGPEAANEDDTSHLMARHWMRDRPNQTDLQGLDPVPETHTWHDA